MVGTALGVAAATIVALSAVLLNDIARETELARDLIAAQQVKDGLEGLSSAIWRLRFATREPGGPDPRARSQSIGLGVSAIETELDYLRAKSGEDIPAADRLPHIEPALRDFLGQARLVEHLHRTQGAGRAQAFLGTSDALAREEAALAATARALEAVTARINDESLEQIRLGEGVRSYVAWLLGGSIFVLAGLFVVFRQLRAHDRDYQARIERLAHFDALTGLPNRSLLDDRLHQAIAVALRANAPLAVLMFDLDGFKNVNDSLGHAAGDALLKAVGESVRQCVRTSDTIGRLGGDEFLAILPETDANGARQLGEKLVDAVSRVRHIDGKAVVVSASLGASLLPDHGRDAQSLLREADAALYEAKRAGKNRLRLR